MDDLGEGFGRVWGWIGRVWGCFGGGSKAPLGLLLGSWEPC